MRQGRLGTTGAAYRGDIDRRDTLLAQYSIGSPSFTELRGRSGRLGGFTLFLVAVDASRWPRLTVHPSGFPDRHILKRALHIDHRIHTVPAEIDARSGSSRPRRSPPRGSPACSRPSWSSRGSPRPPENSVNIEDHAEHGSYLASPAPASASATPASTSSSVSPRACSARFARLARVVSFLLVLSRPRQRLAARARNCRALRATSGRLPGIARDDADRHAPQKRSTLTTSTTLTSRGHDEVPDAISTRSAAVSSSSGTPGSGSRRDRRGPPREIRSPPRRRAAAARAGAPTQL